ncbi:MAG: acetyl-CoA carboxylase carboxyltransferase subunit beta [Sphingobacteriales bacterium]|nr:MAG: acetyl-CoA carboxylase carboxyltransferase subunit beta [Sphingobacteriales bacterium]
MNWFQRNIKGIFTKTTEKREAPDGVWHRCENCKVTIPSKEHKNNFYVCSNCDYHDRIDSEQYFQILFDNKQYEKLFSNLRPIDMLSFTDTKSYDQRLKQTQKQTSLDDAMQVAWGMVEGNALCVAAMDFKFIGGSMGSVVGEKIARAIDYCISKKMPLLIISKSGGARMMEAAFSLMQMAKTSAKLSQLSDAGVPFISLMTDPTTGGVTASYAMLGDLNIAEPKALIGFAGPRVIKETIKKDLPEDFQTSEFLLEHGFLDFIVHRRYLKAKLGELLSHFSH